MRLISLLIIISLTLANCADDPNRKQNIGTVAGGATGALIGSLFGEGTGKLVAVGAGAIVGAFVGNQIGASMDKTDALEAERAAQHGLETSPSGKTTTWRNPDTGNSGEFTPQKAHETKHGYCREFTQKVTVAGKTQDAYGTACRQPDGTWKIVQ